MSDRQVPFALGARVAVLSTSGLIACALLLFGAIFGAVFTAQSDLRGLWEWRGPVERGAGTVVEVRRTSNKVNSRRVMAVEFEHDGRRATSYGVGVTLGPGAPVAVEWPAGHPEGARIAGLDRKPFPVWAALFGVAPGAAGLVLAIIALVAARRRLRLLRSGALAEGRLVAIEPTSMRVNRQRVYKLRYSFMRGDGRTAEAVARTHRTGGASVGSEDTVLYDPDAGGPATVVRFLPGRVVVTEDRIDDMSGSISTVLALLLPAIVVAAWVVIAVVVL